MTMQMTNTIDSHSQLLNLIEFVMRLEFNHENFSETTAQIASSNQKQQLPSKNNGSQDGGARGTIKRISISKSMVSSLKSTLNGLLYTNGEMRVLKNKLKNVLSDKQSCIYTPMAIKDLQQDNNDQQATSFIR